MIKEAQNVLVFPGQGDQQAGMGEKLYEQSPIAREVFEEASEAAGFSMVTLCFEDPKGNLANSSYAQPALVTYSVAKQRHLTLELSIIPHHLVGHSAGEISAAVAAGSIKLVDGIRFAQLRGQAMQDVGPGAMSAILGLVTSEVEGICLQVKEKGESMGLGKNHVVEVANVNLENQTVISGHVNAVAAAEEIARGKGAKIVPLKKINVPSHSSLMQPAKERVKRFLENISITLPSTPLVANFSAQYLSSAEELRNCLAEQITSRIRWIEAIKLIISNGGKIFYESGPGNALTNLVKRIDPTVAVNTLDL